MIQAFRKYFAAAVIVVSLGGGGCASSPNSENDGLDFRLAWPCERLLVAWTINARELQSLVSDNLVVRSDDGLGRLHMSIMRCKPPVVARHGTTPLLFAYIMIPVTVDSVPFVITNILDDGWSSLLLLVADEPSQPLFSQLGYAALGAEISFSTYQTDVETTIELQLAFEAGQVIISANATGAARLHVAECALLSSRIDSISAFFGKETARRFSRVSATVHIAGDTPLALFDLPETPTIAVFDSELVSDRIFWQFPTGQQ